jgi:hypothetical protein
MVDDPHRTEQHLDEREAALWRLGERYGRGRDAVQLVRRVLRLAPRPPFGEGETAPIGPATKGEILDAFAALSHAREEISDLEGRLLDRAAAARNQPGDERITWAEVGRAMGVSDAAVSARWMRRMEDNLDPERWIAPNGRLDMLWLDLVSAEIRRAFGIKKRAVRGYIRDRDEADELTIAIDDEANKIAAGPLNELYNIALTVTLPIPIDPEALAARTDLSWSLDAGSVFDKRATDTTFLAPAWDDDPRQLGRRLADALRAYHE